MNTRQLLPVTVALLVCFSIFGCSPELPPDTSPPLSEAHRAVLELVKQTDILLTVAEKAIADIRDGQATCRVAGGSALHLLRDTVLLQSSIDIVVHYAEIDNDDVDADRDGLLARYRSLQNELQGRCPYVSNTDDGDSDAAPEKKIYATVIVMNSIQTINYVAPTLGQGGFSDTKYCLEPPIMDPSSGCDSPPFFDFGFNSQEELPPFVFPTFPPPMPDGRAPLLPNWLPDCVTLVEECNSTAPSNPFPFIQPSEEGVDSPMWPHGVPDTDSPLGAIIPCLLSGSCLVTPAPNDNPVWRPFDAQGLQWE